MQDDTERITPSFRSTLTHRVQISEIQQLVASLEQQQGESFKERLQLLFFLISTSPEDQPIEGEATIIEKTVKLFCTQNSSEIQSLCINILLSLNAKSRQLMNEADIEIIYATLMRSIQSVNISVSESACESLIRIMNKFVQMKQFLVQQSGFLRKAAQILLRDDNSSTQQSHLIHVKSGILDILLQLIISINLKWCRNDIKELIKILDTLSQNVNEDQQLQEKVQQLLPLFNTKSNNRSELLDNNCDECERLHFELHQIEDQKRQIEEQSRIKDEKIRQIEEQSRINDEKIRQLEEQQRNRDNQINNLINQNNHLQERLQQAPTLIGTTFVCGLCGNITTVQLKCEKCQKGMCASCIMQCCKCNKKICSICKQECPNCHKTLCMTCTHLVRRFNNRHYNCPK